MTAYLPLSAPSEGAGRGIAGTDPWGSLQQQGVLIAMLATAGFLYTGLVRLGGRLLSRWIGERLVRTLWLALGIHVGLVAVVVPAFVVAARYRFDPPGTAGHQRDDLQRPAP